MILPVVIEAEGGGVVVGESDAVAACTQGWGREGLPLSARPL